MLASCEGATGRFVEGEGALSVARAFFAAGVPTVVASLWPVEDDLQTLMTRFHRELRSGGNAAFALRAAQLALLEERGPHTPVRSWGGFYEFRWNAIHSLTEARVAKKAKKVHAAHGILPKVILRFVGRFAYAIPHMRAADHRANLCDRRPVRR